MGLFSSRPQADQEEIIVRPSFAYHFPPKHGSFFGTHFIMGGERFDVQHPEAYLFGDNADLNLLGGRPAPFPYAAPQANEPTRTLKALVNVRKESLRLVRAAIDTSKEETLQDSPENVGFSIEFVLDSDSPCSVNIHYFCYEEVQSQGVMYRSRHDTCKAGPYFYPMGANQQFSQPSHVFYPALFSEEDLSYSSDTELIPVAIQVVAEEGEDPRQSHTTYAVIEKHSDGSYFIKALKQKLFIDGLCYLLQEIYGIENKHSENVRNIADDLDDNLAECIICMSDVRDTLILPCRHLCLCNACADSLRYQANNCPICRVPFRALLQIRAVQKIAEGRETSSESSALANQDGIPPRYEPVALVEALNGPYLMARNSEENASRRSRKAIRSPSTLSSSGIVQHEEILASLGSRGSSSRSKSGRRHRNKEVASPSSIEAGLEASVARKEETTPEESLPASVEVISEVEKDSTPYEHSEDDCPTCGEILASVGESLNLERGYGDDFDADVELVANAAALDEGHGGLKAKVEAVNALLLSQPQSAFSQSQLNNLGRRSLGHKSQKIPSGLRRVKSGSERLHSAKGTPSVSSTPGTPQPLSHASLRSSGESFSSAGSTKKLLNRTENDLNGSMS